MIFDACYINIGQEDKTQQDVSSIIESSLSEHLNPSKLLLPKFASLSSLPLSPSSEVPVCRGEILGWIDVLP